MNYDHLITLEGNTRFRKIIAFKFTEAFQALHRNIPLRENFNDDASFNTAVDNYNNIISVKNYMESQIDENGVLKMPAVKHFLAAIYTYDITIAEGSDVEAITQSVLDATFESENVVMIECTKLLKAYSYKPSKI